MIYVLGGGTFTHVRAHLAIAAPAFGETARFIHDMIRVDPENPSSSLVLTKMADSNSDIVTNDDVSDLVDRLIADPETRMIVMNMALCDYVGEIGDVPSGKYATRLKSREGQQTMRLSPADKIVGRIRKLRPDILVVGFKTTNGATPDEQHEAGMNLLRENSISLVLANDLTTRNNMVVTPFGNRHHETTDRNQALLGLIDIALTVLK